MAKLWPLVLLTVAVILLFTAGCAGNSAPATGFPRPAITNVPLAATSESSLVSAQQTVDAATAIAVDIQAQAERAAATAAGQIALATEQARQTAEARNLTATATAAQATSTAQAAATGTQAARDARDATATVGAALVTGTAQAQAASIEATRTQADADLQLTRIAATREAEQRQAERAQATDAFWTWFPIVLLVGIVGLFAVAAYIGLRLFDLRGRAFNGADGVTSFVLQLPGRRGFVVHVPSRQFAPTQVIDGETRALPVPDAYQAQTTAQDQATRAIRGLPSGSAPQGAAGAVQAIAGGSQAAIAPPLPQVVQVDPSHIDRLLELTDGELGVDGEE